MWHSGAADTVYFRIVELALPRPDASPTEKVYYVLAGELTLIVGGKQTVLKASDSCFIGPNERREIVNRGNDVVTMLVAVSTPRK